MWIKDRTIRETVKAIAVGIGVSMVGILAFAVTLPGNVLAVNPNPRFCRRIDGACLGWTTELAWLDVGQNLGLWMCYCTMAIVIQRLHPIPSREKWRARVTLNLISGFIAGCGAKHLIDAYTVFNPNYHLSIYFGYLIDVISIAATWFIALGLERAKERSVRGIRDVTRYRNRKKSP